MPSSLTNNPPHAVLELTKEEHEFLLRNCESNIAFALSALQSLDSREAQEKMIHLLNQFKELELKLKEAAQ